MKRDDSCRIVSNRHEGDGSSRIVSNRHEGDDSFRIVRATIRHDSTTFPTHPGSAMFSQSSANGLPACRIDMKGDDSSRIVSNRHEGDDSSRFETNRVESTFPMHPLLHFKIEEGSCSMISRVVRRD